MGLFLLLPVISVLGQDLSGATPLLIGLAVGVYGFCQALLQIPFGFLSDRFGRKPLILAGIGIFISGSIVAALADSIAGVIIGRALQGAGAISAVVMALAADLTRDSQRTKIMAIIGASIGLSFILSIIVGPVLMTQLSLSGIFYCIAALGVFSAGLVIFAVPTSEKLHRDRNVSVVTEELPLLLRDHDLLRLDIGILLLHLLITASFVCIPLRLIELNVLAEAHWSVYLKAAVGSLIILLPMVGFAARRWPVRRVMLIGIVGLGIAELGLGIMNDTHWIIVACLVLFFGFFSVLEAMLPSLVSRVAPASSRGTAMGIYSTSQFLGAFLGGVLGGWMIGEVGVSNAHLVLAALCLLWIPVIWGMKEPVNVKNHRLRLNADTIRAVQSEAGREALHAKLLNISGVEEVSVVASDKVAYLKICKKGFDMQKLALYESPV